MDENRFRGASREVRARARELRQTMTPAEVQLWSGLRGWRVGKFRRQHPAGEFILDFYCAAGRVCVEVDGAVHDDPDQKAKDQARTEALAALGIRVLRFRNEDVLEDTPAVLRQIQWALSRSTGP